MNSFFCRLAPAILTSHLCNYHFWNVWNLYRFCHSALPTEIMFDFRIISEHWELASFLLDPSRGEEKGVLPEYIVSSLWDGRSPNFWTALLFFPVKLVFRVEDAFIAINRTVRNWTCCTKIKPLGEGSKRYSSYMQSLAQLTLLNKDLARL